LTYGRDSTIAALATAPGTAAVSIVRLSGPDALAIAERLTGIAPRARYAELCHFTAPSGEPIDEGLLLYFPAPNSYTGEDVVELHGHGGTVVTDWLLESVYRLGARAAQPGEFTLRAFLNDKLDLAQAEAVADLIGSGSRQAARAAMRSLRGGFSAAVTALQASLTTLRVHVEARLDFPDEELDSDDSDCELHGRLDAVLAQLRSLEQRAKQGAVLQDGISVVIAGPPNAGKSSLLNRLAGYDAAIVTPVPGTTRDLLRERVWLAGLPVSIVDTAGLRPSTDPVELEGLRRAHREFAGADRVLWVADIRDGLDAAVAAARRELGGDAAVTVIANKIDLLQKRHARTPESAGLPIVELSALTGEGVDGLVAHLKAAAGWSGDVGGGFSARRRHLAALQRVGEQVLRARQQLPAAPELAAEELRSAQAALSELTGALTSDDLLGEIFSSFCIGK
jgi:tRNA modification GTPase